uniref:Uncharacterized protein n=1 Tax=Romanomermis culicivorax TaxID=13658 RepID=A0A915JHG0_ROMCU
MHVPIELSANFGQAGPEKKKFRKFKFQKIVKQVPKNTPPVKQLSKQSTNEGHLCCMIPAARFRKY